MLKKGVVSLEFILCFLIILIIIYFFIIVNTHYKNKLEDKINFKNINEEICFIKEKQILKNNGVIKNDVCKKSTNNDS